MFIKAKQKVFCEDSPQTDEDNAAPEVHNSAQKQARCPMLRYPLIALFLMIMAGGSARAQAGGSNPASHPPVPPSWPMKVGESPPTTGSAPVDPIERMHMEAVNKANAKRQQQAITDADKLLQLATELKEALGQTNPYTLSVQTIKKTQEIEKLAKSVRNNLTPVTPN